MARSLALPFGKSPGIVIIVEIDAAGWAGVRMITVSVVIG